MLEINKKRLIFKIKEIWFAKEPFEVANCHGVFFRGCKEKFNKGEFNCQRFDTLVIDLRNDLDTIWKKMDKGSCRYFINRAAREGIVVERNSGWEEFYEMNRFFREKKKLGATHMGLTEMKKYCTLFTARKNNNMIAGHLYLQDDHNIRWLVGSSKRLDVNKYAATIISCANRLVIWEAVKYAKNKGIEEFDFGGYYTDDKRDPEKENINIFKKSFGGELATHYIYRKYYSNLFKLADVTQKSILKK